MQCMKCSANLTYLIWDSEICKPAVRVCMQLDC